MCLGTEGTKKNAPSIPGVCQAGEGRSVLPFRWQKKYRSACRGEKHWLMYPSTSTFGQESIQKSMFHGGTLTEVRSSLGCDMLENTKERDAPYGGRVADIYSVRKVAVLKTSTQI